MWVGRDWVGKKTWLGARYPCGLTVTGSRQVLDSGEGAFVFAADGFVELIDERHRVPWGWIGSFREGEVYPVGGRCVIFRRSGYTPTLMMAFAHEEPRVSYMDGCRYTTVVHPPRKGEPMLHHLVVPPNTDQKMHTHPSMRLGVILEGRVGLKSEKGLEWLESGDVFAIDEDERHAMITESQAVRVLVFHPEGDYGPSDEENPMLSRTAVG